MDPRIVEQRDSAVAWFASVDARLTAERIIQKFRLIDDAEDLLSEARLKVFESMSRRAAPLVGDDVKSNVVKYAARSLGNLGIDRARRKVLDKKQEIELAQSLPSPLGPERQAEAAVFMEALNSMVNQIARRNPPCSGCKREIIFAAATEVIQLALLEGNTNNESAEGDEWIDDAIQTVIDRLSPGSLTSSARRKRRQRCKNCVMELLSAALQGMGYRRD